MLHFLTTMATVAGITLISYLASRRLVAYFDARHARR
jgi:hypothetical protein